MALITKLEHWGRYKDVLLLIARHGRADLLHQAGLDGQVADQPKETARAEALTEDLERLGATFVKFGQMLSTRSDLLPPTYLAALARLQDHVEPFPFEDVERIVEEELGVRISKAFSGFEEQPLAAASLGQVHRALLRDGRRVAVKVQRPEVRQEVQGDLAALAELARAPPDELVALVCEAPLSERGRR
jgi:predicted unusual protein kinase regulating ubiquinone biosynthesis (AarF/ABC1/UbiB family)